MAIKISCLKWIFQILQMRILVDSIEMKRSFCFFRDVSVADSNVYLNVTRKKSSLRCTRKQQTCLSLQRSFPFLGLLLHNSCLFELNMYGDTPSLPEKCAIASRRRRPMRVSVAWHVLPSMEAMSNWRSMYLQRDAAEDMKGRRNNKHFAELAADGRFFLKWPSLDSERSTLLCLYFFGPQKSNLFLRPPTVPICYALLIIFQLTSMCHTLDYTDKWQFWIILR